MTEASWDSESSEPPPKKKGVPKWIWACGTGCLLMVILGGLLTVVAVMKFKEAMDPEVQWAKLEQVLPYDEPHPDLTIASVPFMTMIPGFEGMWTLFDHEGRSCVVMVFGGAQKEKVEEGMFDPEAGEMDFGAWTGNMGQHDFEVGTVTIQGRELRCARFRSFPQKEGEEPPAEEPPAEVPEGEHEVGIRDAMKKAVIRVDITPEDRDDIMVIVEFSKVMTLERVSDEEIAEFLAHFHIGQDR